jgi:PPOX class probable F420-dependent enzyme
MALNKAERGFIARARTATLGTIAPDGRPRLVPICFVLIGDVLYMPIDEKPKETSDPRQLARIRDIARRADVTVLVDRWDEDWNHLAWLRIEGRATPYRGPAERARAIAALRVKYRSTRDTTSKARPLIRIAIERVRQLGRPQRSRKIAFPVGRRQWVELIAWR